MALTFSSGCGTNVSSFYILTKDNERIRVKQMDDGCIIGKDGYVRLSYLLNTVVPELKQYMLDNFVLK